MSESPKSPISVGISAKAEAQLQIKGEVPPSAMGRAVNAIVDAFSPFTERRGLRGDELRLQREDVLLEIARRAALRSDLEGGIKFPLPPKIVVPLLEKASLEDPNSELIDWWAGLVANGSNDKTLQHPIFADFLSRMTAAEVIFLESVAGLKRKDSPAFQFDIAAEFDGSVNKEIHEFLERDAPSDIKFGNDKAKDARYFSFAQEVISRFFDKLIENGMVGIDITLSVNGFRRFLDREAPYGGTLPIHHVIDNCVSIGVMERERLAMRVRSPFIGENAVYLNVARFTATGELFVEACRRGRKGANLSE